MKSNSMLTYLLYALLAALIITAGYKACQMQTEKQRKAQEEAEWQETLKKLYPDGDSTAGGSSYVSRDSTAPTTGSKPSVSQSGIEGDPAPATKAKAKATKTPSTTTTAGSGTAAAQPQNTPAKNTAAKGVGGGRWEVRAGTFQYKDGARARLEEVIRMGYTNAEIGKANNGWATVIVLRTNDKNRAIQITDQLERRGIDAAVFARGK